jgi:hypothetical protein
MLLLPALLLMLAVGAPQTARTVKGRYRHPGQGFSIVVPSEATGLLEGDPAIERGIRLLLPSGGNIFVWGEANSLEWPAPVDGIRWAVAQQPTCSSQGIRDGRMKTIRDRCLAIVRREVDQAVVGFSSGRRTNLLAEARNRNHP